MSVDPAAWMRRDDGALKCPNCRRWTLSPSPHLDGLCMPPEQRTPKMVRGELHGATASRRDIVQLREAFERGGEMTKEVAAKTLKIPERRFRAAVSALRHEGYPVVSFSEKRSKYRKAIDDAELDEFIRTELESRAFDELAQVKALRDGRRRWLAPIVVTPVQETLPTVVNSWSDD